MKNKPLTYLLIVSVAAVWGIIFYRIFSAGGDDEAGFHPATKSALVNESLDDYQLKDTFTLALNYRDPFLSQNIKLPEQPVSSGLEIPVSAFKAPAPMKPMVNWEIIKYTGYISNTAGKRAAAILNISGKEYMLSEGQSAAGVKLLKNMKDSVKVSYQDKTKNIRIQ